MFVIPKEVPMTEEMRESLSKARVNVSLASAMLTYQMFRCEMFFVDAESVPTAAALVTSNKNMIMLNKNFWLDVLQDEKERAFVLLHEVLHIFLNHGGRCKDNSYIHPLWNMATDFNINLTCAGVSYRDGRKTMNDRFEKYISKPANFPICYDEKYLGMSSDQIYQSLIEDFEEEKGMTIGEWIEQQIGEALDDVIEWEGDSSAQEKRNIQSAIASIEHARSTNSIGDNEADLINLFKEMAKPKISWTDRITHSVTSTIDDRETYNRLSRRSSDVCFPTHIGEHVSVFFGIDSSGSMSSDDYMRALGELRGILDQFDSWVIDVYTCDVKAHLIGEYSSEEDQDFVNHGINLRGGGGTSMKALLEECNYLVEEGEKGYDVCIVVTDGFIPDHDDIETVVPSIFVVTENGNKHLTMTHSEVIHVE